MALSIAGRRQQMRSLTIRYLEPARQGPIEVDSHAVRGTRTATTAQLTMRQGSDAVAAALAALIVGRSSPQLEDGAMPDVRPYEFRHCLGPEPSEPLLVQFRSRLGIDGFVDEEGELWTGDGQLLVQSRQLAVLLAGSDAA